ncbi:hypothetical protein BGZ97_002617 [Linnemannia gamsii]|uniref:F-box domain-containing protein n=1 Tax=Linnemannia gamsii TaxID=64522 RepID=A0A9P6UH66_9FUNG|nr:hypothetical protein BGZ97_002617 [Linnemannia gamsii]
MFDIPELDEKVCLQLHRHSVLQCAKVNKKWRRIFTPYIWRDLSGYRSIRDSKAFCKMILHDYLEEHERQQQQQPPKENPRLEQSTQKRSSPPLSLLAKYGACIRLIPENPSSLLNDLTNGISYLSKEQPIDLTPQDLFRHLLKHCTALDVPHLRLKGSCLQSNHLLETVADFIVPLAHRMVIGSGPVESWKLKHLLTRCSSKLKELTLDTVIIGPKDGKGDEEESDEEEVINTGAQPRYLRLDFCEDALESKAFWSWLWKRSMHVERLEVLSTYGMVHNLAEGMLSHMSNLDKIELGSETFAFRDEDGYDAYCMEQEDEHVATLLSSCRKGWKAVQIRSGAFFGDAAWNSLVNHFFTLEEMVVLGGVSIGGNQLRRILSSCPNLHTLITIDDGTYFNSDDFSVDMYAEQFVDLDHATLSLNPWACERSLKVLKVLVIRVSDRPNRYRYSAPQSLVYKRLARFTNLETLWLGHDPHIEVERHPSISVEPQDDRLQMSLESGLDMLQGLTALQELGVSNMETLIGWKELQWMTQHWPRLCIIRGMDEKGRDKEAAQWLQDHHSGIKLQAEWRKKR